MSRRRGFTLLEVVIVVLVLGILAALAVPTFKRVVDRSQESSETTTVQGVLSEARALGAATGRVTRSHVEDAVGDLSGYSTTAVGTPSTSPRHLSVAEDGIGVGVALLSRTGACILGSTTAGTSDVRSVKDAPACTGETALGLRAPTSSSVSAPQNLTTTSGVGTVTLRWDPPQEGTPSGYAVSVDGTERTRTVERTLTVDGLVGGVTHTFSVAAVDATGTLGAPTQVSAAARADGVWDVRLAWVYNANTVCHDGASSWTYRALATTTTSARDGRYRLELKYVNPDPPFSEARVVEEATGQALVIGSTGQDRLTPSQVERDADGTTPTPERPTS